MVLDSFDSAGSVLTQFLPLASPGCAGTMLEMLRFCFQLWEPISLPQLHEGVIPQKTFQQHP